MAGIRFLLEDGPGVYKLQAQELDDLARASAGATRLWASPRVLAVVVLDDRGTVDANYSRPNIVPSRIPEGWTSPNSGSPPPPAPVVSLSGEDELFETKAVDPAKPACAACGTPFPDTPYGRYEGDPGSSRPGDRQLLRRCMDCGCPLPGKTHFQIEQMHLRVRERPGPLPGDENWWAT